MGEDMLPRAGDALGHDVHRVDSGGIIERARQDERWRPHAAQAGDGGWIEWVNGLEIGDSYYWRLSDNKDLLLSGYAYTKTAPMISAQFRALTNIGAYQITGYVTYGSRIPLGSTLPATQKDFRGYIDANGRFQLDSHWSVAAGVENLTDKRYFLFHPFPGRTFTAELHWSL